jgi:AcrR family transcriptional regulator
MAGVDSNFIEPSTDNEIMPPLQPTPPQERAPGVPPGAIDESPAPLGRRERRKLEVRTRIYSVARELFTKQGFDATTVDEIARVADVAPATFFNHFQSKQALLGLMTGEVFETLHLMTSQHLEGEGSSSEKLRAFISAATEGISASRGIARDVLLEFMRSDSTATGPHPYLERLFEPFVALIEQGQRSGEMRSDYDAAFLAQMAVGMMNSAITNWLANPDFPVETGLVEAAEFALVTLRPEMGEDASERKSFDGD